MLKKVHVGDMDILLFHMKLRDIIVSNLNTVSRAGDCKLTYDHRAFSNKAVTLDLVLSWDELEVS